MQTLFLTTFVVGTILLLFQLFFILFSFNSEKLQDFIFENAKIILVISGLVIIATISSLFLLFATTL